MRNALRFPMICLSMMVAPVVFGGTSYAEPTLPIPVQAQVQTEPAGPVSSLAQTDPELHRLFVDMGLYAVFEVMSVEGQEGAADLEADMFPSGGGSAWRAVTADLYAADRMVARFEAALPKDMLSAEALAELRAFYDSDLGARVAAGEVAARRAFLDPGIEESATDLARERAAEGASRSAQLRQFIAANDLIEHNVSGALNSNLAFLRGLSDGGAWASEMPEDLMLAEVWGQEAEIRTDLTDWLFGYQTLAYEGLTDAEFQIYVDMTMTDAGQVLNAVLFAGFAEVFEAISYDLGRAAARFVSGDET